MQDTHQNLDACVMTAACMQHATIPRYVYVISHQGKYRIYTEYIGIIRDYYWNNRSWLPRRGYSLGRTAPLAGTYMHHFVGRGVFCLLSI